MLARHTGADPASFVARYIAHMPAVYIVSATAKRRCAFTISRTSTCQCSLACLTGGAGVRSHRVNRPAGERNSRVAGRCCSPVGSRLEARLRRERAETRPRRRRRASCRAIRSVRQTGTGRRRWRQSRPKRLRSVLYRRLETLAQTKGRFEVNVSLPIAFDGAGSLEVDLLCADARVADESMAYSTRRTVATHRTGQGPTYFRSRVSCPPVPR